MKKILFPAICAMCITPSFADFYPYIGGNIDWTYANFDSEVKQTMDNCGIELETINFGLGTEAGVVFDLYHDIYRGGVSITYDYLFDKNAYVSNSALSNMSASVSTGFSAVGFEFDNYIRVNEENAKRTDLIFGIGFANAKERIRVNIPGVYSDNISDDANTFVFKFGMNGQITNHTDLYLAIRDFIPMKDIEIKSVFLLQTGFKLHF